MKRRLLAVACAALAGCAPRTFIHPNPEAVNRGADMAQCEYEIEMSARGIAVPWWYNNRQATGYLIGAAIGSAIRADRLRTLCMQAKGYIPVDAPGVAPYGAAGAPPPSPQAVAASYSSADPYSGRAPMFPPPGTPAIAVAQTPMMAPTRPQPPGSTPVVANAIKGESKYQYTAEGVAKAEGCNPPTAAMTSKGAGMELFAIACPNGTTLAIRCEIEGCRVLR